MADATAPDIWLGPRWYAWLEFGPGSSHAAFERLADRLCNEFGGVRAESLPDPADVGKEYLYLQFGASELLLMRRDEWTALGAFYPNVPLVLRVGAAFGAVRRGWRWPLYRAWGHVIGHRKTPNQTPAADRRGMIAFRDSQFTQPRRLLSWVVRRQEGTTVEDAGSRLGRRMRWLLLACGPVNAAGAVCFAPPFPYARRGFGLPEPDPFYLWVLATWIAAFGVALARQGWTGRADRAVLALAAWGKGVFAALLVCGTTAGGPPPLAIAAAGVDLSLAVVFAVWLWRSSGQPAHAGPGEAAHGGESDSNKPPPT